jgi:hypothetical protein
MVSSAAQKPDGSEASTLVDVLQVSCALVEVIALFNELHQIARLGCVAYSSELWNIIDMLASSFLLAGVGCHFVGVAGAASGMHPVGGMGCALKWFGLVDYLRAFQATGSLVRMITVILQDMSHLLIVLAVILTGAMFFLIIEAPFSDAFGYNEDLLGPFWPLLTVLLTMSSQLSFHEQGYASSWSIGMLLFFIFSVVIVM